MKKVFSFFALAAVALSVGLTSCGKEDVAEPLNVDLNRTATVKGKILVNTDETKAAADQKWSAPGGVTLTATVPYSSLNGSAKTGDYVVAAEKIQYSSSTGEYTITVPVGVNATTVTVKLAQFTGEVKRNVPGTTDTKTYSVIWSGSTGSVSVTPGTTGYIAEWKKNGQGTTGYTVVTNADDKIN
jgi:hypothetical protein